MVKKVVTKTQPAHEYIGHDRWCDICGSKFEDKDWESSVSCGSDYDGEPQNEADVCPKCFRAVLLPFIESHKPERKA